MGKSHKASSDAKNYRQVKKAERWRNSLPQGKTHLLVTPYQMVSPENIHISNIVQIVQVALGNIHICIYMYIIINFF